MRRGKYCPSSVHGILLPSYATTTTLSHSTTLKLTMADTADTADAAAFFAKKKTKKKKYKSFNANKIDASTVAASTHVDAPEISAETDGMAASLGGLTGLGLGGGGGIVASGGGGGAGSGGADGSLLGGGDDQWADAAQTVGGGGWGSNNRRKDAAGSSSSTTAAASSGADSKVAELLDMQALNARRNTQDDVAERLRIEETKAKLARAKEGMAKEAERLVAEKAEREAKAAARSSGGGGGSLSALGGGGGGRRRRRRQVDPRPRPQCRGGVIVGGVQHSRTGIHGRIGGIRLPKGARYGERGTVPGPRRRRQDTGREGEAAEGGDVVVVVVVVVVFFVLADRRRPGSRGVGIEGGSRVRNFHAGAG